MATLKVQAEEVQAEDFIPGLDNGFVVDTELGDVSLAGPGDRHYHLLGGMVTITYHDAEGDECYLILSPESSLTVERS